MVIKSDEDVSFVRGLASNSLVIKNFLNDNSNGYSLITEFAKDKSYQVINNFFHSKPYLLPKKDIKGEGLLHDMHGTTYDDSNIFKQAYERKLYFIKEKIEKIINTEINKLQLEINKLQP